MRSYLKSTVKPLIPETVQNAIKDVTKTQPSFQSDGKTVVTQTTTDDVWIPSKEEVTGSSSAYHTLFEDTNAKRAKTKTDGTSLGWWLRSAKARNAFHFVSPAGVSDYQVPHNACGIALGFCT